LLLGIGQIGGIGEICGINEIMLLKHARRGYLIVSRIYLFENLIWPPQYNQHLVLIVWESRKRNLLNVIKPDVQMHRAVATFFKPIDSENDTDPIDLSKLFISPLFLVEVSKLNLEAFSH
jgi:hypothetical protein